MMMLLFIGGATMEGSSPGYQKSERLSGVRRVVPIDEEWSNRSDRESKKELNGAGMVGRMNPNKMPWLAVAMHT
jgi:hypothetical protein